MPTAKTNHNIKYLFIFPQQQWLHVRALMLRHNYTGCPVRETCVTSSRV